MNGMQHNTAIDPGLVAAKAYEIWQSWGCPEGVAEQTWLEAERQLMSRDEKPTEESRPSESRLIAEPRHAVANGPVSEPPPASPKTSISEPPAATTAEAKSKKSAAGQRRTTRR